ncbi:MAG: DUF4041 domain-containing protein [Myxococcales bacterium]|nr:DUF4041 domain-containing protein [Myxococcales bacterium]
MEWGRAMQEHIDELSIPHTLTTIDGQQAVFLAGPTSFRQEVVGEAYNPEQMSRILASVQGRTDAVLPAWLMPEPGNVHDPNAIIVWILGGKVGYLPREVAAWWQPILARLFARYRSHVACHAWVEPPSATNGGEFGVVLWLPAQQASSPQPLPVPHQPATAIASPAVAAVAAPVAAAAVQEIVTAPAPALPTPEQLEQLRADIARAKKDLKTAQKDLSSVEEALEIQSFGFYQPRYGFESSAQYVVRLKAIRDEQQALIKGGKAAPCDTTWKVGGSAAEGKKMVKQQAKLMLRAFNGECDAAIAKVKYDNVTTLEERIGKAHAAINKLGEVQRVFIASQYFDLKLAELRLVHEHREKVQEEKEEQRRVKDQMREEQKAQEEIEKAKAEAEKEEAISAAALEKARAELAAASGKQHEKFEALVTRLENELKDALERKAKAIARAQLTKSGHVYVLSNIGSFGAGIYKIGMTRRLEPLERIDELGDASVPFPFDVHAIIYSEDAPGLENKIHKAFADRRVNIVNMRKEYFRVTLDEVRDVVEKLHGGASENLCFLTA